MIETLFHHLKKNNNQLAKCLQADIQCHLEGQKMKNVKFF